MTDYKRMEWQVRINRAATFFLVLMVFLGADEVYWAIKYHFPWWDDVAMGITIIGGLIARFIMKHTEQYRFDR